MECAGETKSSAPRQLNWSTKKTRTKRPLPSDIVATHWNSKRRSMINTSVSSIHLEIFHDKKISRQTSARIQENPTRTQGSRNFKSSIKVDGRGITDETQPEARKPVRGDEE